MLKIIKYVIIISIATVVGILASDYDGYVMIVAADKSIKMNLVIFGLSVFVISFALIILYRVIELILLLPTIVKRKFGNILSLHKEENLANVIEAIVVGDNNYLNHLKFAKVAKIAPEEMQDSIVFAKLRIFARENQFDKLEEAISKLDRESVVYRFFLAYLLAARGSSYEAIAIVKDLLKAKKTEFRKSIVDLAAELAEMDEEFAEEILKTYQVNLTDERRKALSIELIKSLKTYQELKKVRAYLYTDEETKILFADKLIAVNEPRVAKKILTTIFNSENINSEALSLYIKNYEVSLERVYSMVCSMENANYESMLVLLEEAFEQKEQRIFNNTREFIEQKALISFSDEQKQHYENIIYKYSLQAN